MKASITSSELTYQKSHLKQYQEVREKSRKRMMIIILLQCKMIEIFCNVSL